jgi:hypothetical protein
MSSGHVFPFGFVSDLYNAGIGDAKTIQGAPVEPAPTNDDILQYNAGNNTWENKNIGEIIEITGSDNQVMRYDADTGFIQNSNLIITDTDNLTGVNTLQVNELDGPAAGITTTADIDAGSNKVKSTAVPAANDELTNKLYVDGEVADKVDGPASATNNAVARFDGTTGKLIQNSLTTITDVGGLFSPTIDTTKISTDTLSEYGENGFILSTTNIDVGPNYIRSSYTPLATNDLVNKSYSDSNTVNKVIGPASAAANRICVFSGTTGKIIKQEGFGINGGILNAYDGVGNPTTILFGNDLSMLNQDITQVNEINVDTISSNAGGVVEFTDRPTTTNTPLNAGDLTNKLYVDTRLGYLYAGLSNSATVSGTTLGSLLPLTGDGTLTVPANGFVAGDSFHLVVAGTGSFQNGNTLTVSLVNGGTLASIVINLETVAGTSWELEADFTIRSIGASGVIATNFDFTYQRGSPTFDFKGARQVQTSAIDTTINNTLGVNAQFSGGTNSMETVILYLKRMH